MLPRAIRFFLKFESPPNDRHKLGTAGHVDALAKVEEKNNPTARLRVAYKRR